MKRQDYDAVLTVWNAGKMTASKRRAIVRWLRNTAGLIEREAGKLSTRFSAKYMK